MNNPSRTPNSPTRAAVLDLGSNSFHALVADVESHTLRPALRSREMLHLGRSLERDGRLGPDARARAAEVAAHLAELARRAGAEWIFAVATSAIRDAHDGEATVAELSRATGVAVEVLDGNEEARLAHLGACASVGIDAEPVLVIDLGGGSLELAMGPRTGATWSVSLPLGASRLSALIASDPPSVADLTAIDSRIEHWLDPISDQVTSRPPATTVLVGGTVRAIARVLAAGKNQWLPSTTNQMAMTTAELDEMSVTLNGVDLPTRASLPRMKDRRADHIHVAARVLTRVMRALELPSAVISDWGLREGVLLERVLYATQQPSPRPGPLTAAALRSAEVARLHTAHTPADPHGPHVAMLAGELFDQTIALHALDDTDRDMLVHAATLHAIGQALSLRRQQDHGAYLIEHAEMRGFSPSQCAMLATLVRFHPSRGIDDAFPAYAGLTRDEQERTERLLGLLQLADALDAAHDQVVTGMTVTMDLRQRRVIVNAEGGQLHLSTADHQRRTAVFERAMEVSVELTDATVGQPAMAVAAS